MGLFRSRRLAALLLTLGFALPAEAGLKFQFDYSYDSYGFFDAPERRESLELAGAFLNRYVDSLDALIPDETNKWLSFFTPPDADSNIFLTGGPIPQDTMLIHVAGRPLAGRLAQATDFGAVGQGDPDWVASVANRGQLGASETPALDFGPMGGSISFNNNLTEVPWHFGVSATGIKSNEFDFVTVAMHELSHLLGFGISRSFDTYVTPQHTFTGPDSKLVGSSSNATLKLDDADAHWLSGTKGVWNGKTQEALLAPGIFPGRRTYMSSLDRAALRDIGWEEAEAGDANLDRLFNTTDILTMFQAGKYETTIPATWADGDFNDDALFESGDLVVALQSGNYEQPVAALAAAAIDEVESIAGVVLEYDRTNGNVEVRITGGELTAFE
ncbi:MAG: hypothetical protein KDA92_23510, partial [Planctomycetales bacterium]|nr:hypothetical protein [Planctomycetales bacterium]